jgi:hypothetical protein
MASAFAAATSTQVTAFSMSAEMMIDHNNLGNILKVSEELCQAFSRLISPMSAFPTCTSDVQHWVEGPALKLSALPCGSQTAW